MAPHDDPSGLAALAICESLLLALNDGELLSEADIMALLEDAAETLVAASQAASVGPEATQRRGAAALIQRIISGGNSVRRR